MDSFEVNKIAGAVLGTLLFAFGTGFVAELIYHPKPAGKAGFDLPLPKPPSGGEAKAAKVEPIATRLASADAEKGKGGTKACQGCHSFEKGGPNKSGPDLWNIVERPKGGHEGFEYSGGMKAKGGAWTYDDLDHFLAKPSDFVKGTKMTFQGISSAQERANVIAYLRTLADSPKPLPAAEKKEEGKPAESEKKPEADKPAESKPAGAQTKPEDSKPAEKPAEPEKKPEAVKPEDAKPAEPKAEDAKPAEPKAEDAKPAEEKPAEGKPSEQKPTDQ